MTRPATMDTDDRKRAVRRSALLLLVLVSAVYGGFILMTILRSRG